MRRANFRNQKTIEDFDFSFNPKINRAQVIDLATCRFMEEKACLMIAGPCGTGKSHLAQALDAFPNKLLGAATIDRVRHGAYNVILDGKSFRSEKPLSSTSKSTIVKGGKTS